ncbi:MAG TPA: hypothetical protein ENK40_01270 [Gammaproteobacteria bacterium]|nr:hypothetical protein [Gammaproteobacteria bacterium]
MSKEIEIRLDDLYAPVSFGGGGRSSSGENSKPRKSGNRNNARLLNNSPQFAYDGDGVTCMTARRGFPPVQPTRSGKAALHITARIAADGPNPQKCFGCHNWDPYQN